MVAELRGRLPHPRAAHLDADAVGRGARRHRADDRALPRHRRPRRLAACPRRPRACASASKSPAVVALRQRLIITGDLDPVRRRFADLRFLCRGRRAPLPGPPRPQLHRHHDGRDGHGHERAGRGAHPPARDQRRAACAAYVGQSRQPLRGRQHPGRPRRDGGGRRGRTPATPPASARSTASRRS